MSKTLFHAARVSRLRLVANAARLATVFALAWPAASRAQPAPQAPAGQGTLLGDLGGVRPALDKYGISLGLQSINEVLGNPNGARRRGATFDGQNVSQRRVSTLISAVIH